ncbi:translation initiation factor IF-2-like isoform X2 [Catharus ustulatus]|uniref:translation initiation factor IF-2-like isoform X2 n=1 Tax=Catharus ustulatus TaxID=91951 RepID=UPI00140B4756|nr:translation initiation factor IF-2-like isoform X2 [Catharus ustulatus]
MRKRLDAVVFHLVLGELKAPATKEGEPCQPTGSVRRVRAVLPPPRRSAPGRRSQTARTAATPAGPERRPRCGTSLRLPGAPWAGVSGPQPAFPLSPPQPAPTATLGVRGKGATRDTSTETVLPGCSWAKSGARRGNAEGGTGRGQKVSEVLMRAGSCPAHKRAGLARLPGARVLGRGRDTEHRDVLRASLLPAKSKRPEGRLLLYAGASIYMCIYLVINK